MPPNTPKSAIPNPFSQQPYTDKPETVEVFTDDYSREVPESGETGVVSHSLEFSNDDSAKSPALHLAQQLFEFKYHPVVIFGHLNSGKTALVTSLLASLRLSPDWQVVAELNDPVVSVDNEYGRNQKEEATALFFKSVQEFIDGRAGNATKRRTPFFIPLTVRSNASNQSQKIALMESSGENYSADPNTPQYFASLWEDTETLIRNFEGGISFIYIVPYTQVYVRDIGADVSVDPALKRAAEAAVVGTIEAYQKIRVNKSRDSHLLVVSKWDAHYDAKKQEEELEMSEILLNTANDVEGFLRSYYPQAFTSLKGLNVDEPKKLYTNYCAGLITRQTITPLTKDLETREAIRYHQKKIWRWIWGNASSESGGSPDPFPVEKRKTGLFALIDKILERLS